MTEAYCIRCRRMVPARRNLITGVFFLVDHYRFDVGKGKDSVPCIGKVSNSKITHGMEDPKAAFRYARRAWGRVGRTVPQDRRYADYVD